MTRARTLYEVFAAEEAPAMTTPTKPPAYVKIRVSVPADLAAEFRLHCPEVAPSHATAEGMRAALRERGVEPPVAPPPTRTSKATREARRRRVEG